MWTAGCTVREWPTPSMRMISTRALTLLDGCPCRTWHTPLFGLSAAAALWAPFDFVCLLIYCSFLCSEKVVRARCCSAGLFVVGQSGAVYGASFGGAGRSMVGAAGLAGQVGEPRRGRWLDGGRGRVLGLSAEGGDA